MRSIISEQGTLNRIVTDFLSETLEDRRQQVDRLRIRKNSTENPMSGKTVLQT